MIMRRAFLLGAAAIVPLLSAIPASASSPELIAAAKEEGELVLYTAMQRKVIAKSVEMFQDKYGIKVTYVRKGSAGTTQLIEAERASKDFRADVTDLWDPTTFNTWKKEGLFLAYKPEGGDMIDKQLVDPDWEIVIPSPVTMTMVYNTHALKPEEAPKSFKDLLDPKWKGKLVHSDPVYSGATITAINTVKNLYGWDYYKGLAQQNPLIVQSIGATPRMLLSGEAQVGVIGIDADIRDFIAKGEPLKVIIPEEGVPYFTWGAAILKTATHKNAAKLWMDFLISEEHQAFLASQKYYPSRTDVAAAPESPKLSSLKLLKADTEWLKDNRQVQNDTFGEIMRDAPKAKGEK